jgi:O-antigen ligase
LLLTFTRGAWIAVVLALLGFILIRSRRAPKLLLVPAAAIPLGLCFIPSQYIDRFLSSFAIIDTSASYRLSIWRSSLRMFKDRIFIGVGVGEKAFNEEFMKYAEEGVMAPHHSHNLFLEIGCQLGIFALVLFVFLLFTRVRHRATYSLYVRESGVSSACTAAGVVTFALLAFGMTDYIWYSSPMSFLFWTVFGLGSATLRIAKADHDERYLSETSDSSAYEAATNIFIDSKFE